MGIRIGRIFVILLLSLLTACVGPVPKIDSSPEVLARVGTVAVIRPPEPKAYTILNLGHPGMAFGLIGGLIAAGDMKAKQDQISAAFKAQGVSFSANLADRIAAELTTAGYEARVEDAPWIETDGRYQLQFENISSNADAVLVVSPTIIGYVASGIASDYLPTMTAVVTLLGRDRKEHLYRGFHASGWIPNADGWKGTPAKTTFSNFDALMSSTKASADTLNDAGAAIAQSVATALTRGASSRATTLDDLRDLLPGQPVR